MMLKKFRCLIFAMVLILIVVSCTVFAAKKPVKLVFGHVWNMDHFMVKSDLYFKKLVEKNSKGQIVIDYYPAGQLGSSREMDQATRTGGQQMTITSPAALVAFLPKLGTFNMPYLYRDQKHIIKVAQKFTSIIDRGEMEAKTNLHILNVRVLPARHLTTKFPVNKLEDIKGLKIRVPENGLFLALWRALGAIPTALPFSDVYTALATGTIDAQENPLIDIYVQKFYEQVKYCALTAHMQELEMLLINLDCWKNLTAKQQKILSDAAVKSAQMGMDDLKAVEEKYHNLLAKEGMKFTSPNLVPFREKAKTIWGQFGDEGLIKRVDAIK
jgi:tripartite ATP-independent transporter DctP family solute receptor